MDKWTDGLTMGSVLTAYYSGNEVVSDCCDSPQVHFYVHKFNPASSHGSAWAWCSNCKKYVHLDGFTADIKNCNNVNPSKLCAVPEYLESIKSYIDEHSKQNRP